MSALEGLVVTRSTAAQQVAAGLASRIVAGAFAPGVRLRESAIATELGVARNTVREAVRILELSGLVRHEVNRGAVVISPTPEKVEELYAARERLETAAVSRPAETPEIDAMRKAYEDLVDAAASHDVLRIVDVDLAFHATIVSMLHSSRIDEFYAGLLVELRFYLTVLSLEDREFEHPDDILTDHREILEAIEAGDTSLAAQQVRSHIERNGKRVLEILHGRD
jgi:DNA-binding GntR family transcriptional regulator